MYDQRGESYLKPGETRGQFFLVASGFNKNEKTR
jgi:hypothetical protein